ncbi:CvpA family protein [Ghiorsea bivora]|uniref:CvpA family protein n=1 Tax=Ghiorsea bivora TaxID=1485545 RepID=UPI00056E6440|nr:CvpA family protein [Ghiorsea bivora]
MNYFDYILITIVGLSMVLSIWRGFVREIISLIGLILAFFIAGRMSSDVGALLHDWIENNTIANVAGFVLIFVFIMIVVGLISALIRKLVDMADLTATDRTLGVFFGAARGILLIGVAFLVYTSYAKPDQTWMQKSLLTPYALQLSDLIGKTIPKDYPLSTQNGAAKNQLPSVKQVVKSAVETAKDHISDQDQEAMKSLLLDTIKDAKP